MERCNEEILIKIDLPVSCHVLRQLVVVLDENCNDDSSLFIRIIENKLQIYRTIG